MDKYKYVNPGLESLFQYIGKHQYVGFYSIIGV